MNSLIDINNVGECCEISPKSCGTELTMVQVLEQKRDRLQKQLDDVNSAIDGLTKSPEVVGLLELIRRVNRI